MSYSRIPYIYSNGSEMFMDGQYIDEDVINILLYDLHQEYRKEELEERVKLGKEAKDRITKESEEMCKSLEDDDKGYEMSEYAGFYE